MKSNIRLILLQISTVLEIVISIIILGSLVLFIGQLVINIDIANGENLISETISQLLSSCFSIIIGIELVKMLVKHSVTTAIEVLILSTARQMVVEHSTPSGALITILGIAILIGIQKFLLKGSEIAEKETNPDATAFSKSISGSSYI